MSRQSKLRNKRVAAAPARRARKARTVQRLLQRKQGGK